MPNSTPRDQVITTLQHREPELMPYAVPMEKEIIEGINTAMGGTKWFESLINFFHGTVFPLPNRKVFEDGRYVDAYGSLWQPGSAMHLLEPVMKDTDLDTFEWPDIETLWAEKKAEREQCIGENQERYRTAHISFGLFERGWALRGFAEVLMDMAADKTFAHELFDAIMEHQMRMVAHLLELDVDAMFFSDDWGFQRGLIMGPDLWREYIKPRKRKMIEHVHAAGKKAMMHCCGTVMEIMPEIVEIKLDCLQSLQPEAMDVFELKRRFGKDIALYGGGPSQSTIPFGTPDEIRACFRRLREELGKGGGYICGSAKAIMTDTSIENAIATVEGICGHELPPG